jgi:hypothetical protein
MHEHQGAGIELLRSLGISQERARFAWTHGNWSGEKVTLEDLIVTLADKAWKGKRIEALETRTAELLSAATSRPTQDCYSKLDEILQDLSEHADRKMAWQSSFAV